MENMKAFALIITLMLHSTLAGSRNTDIVFNDQNDNGPYKVHIQREITSFVCNEDSLVDITVSITERSNVNSNTTQPPADYEYFDGVGYYKYYSNKEIWDDARHTCDRDGAYLVIINSDAESNVMKTIMGRSKTDGSLSGFHDRFVEGEYLTIFGKPLNSTGFYKWSPKQPDNGFGTEDCGYIYSTGLLNDVNCTLSLTFICEFDPQNTQCDTQP